MEDIDYYKVESEWESMNKDSEIHFLHSMEFSDRARLWLLAHRKGGLFLILRRGAYVFLGEAFLAEIENVDKVVEEIVNEISYRRNITDNTKKWIRRVIQNHINSRPIKARSTR